jgi:hypothetical protein
MNSRPYVALAGGPHNAQFVVWVTAHISDCRLDIGFNSSPTQANTRLEWATLIDSNPLPVRNRTIRPEVSLCASCDRLCDFGDLGKVLEVKLDT